MNKSSFASVVDPFISYETSKSLDFLYRDSLTAQSRNIFNALDKFQDSIKEEFNKNYIIIEIGTYFGGFTKILSDSNLGKNSNGIYTFDIQDLDLNKRQDMLENKSITIPNKKVSESLKEHCQNVYFHKGDVFSEASIRFIVNIIKNQKLIIFCDGGYKPIEFSYFAQALKKGDFILAHDYSFDEKHFEENKANKIWYWLETKNADIQAACDQYELETFMEQDFNNCVWTCRRKK